MRKPKTLSPSAAFSEPSPVQHDGSLARSPTTTLAAQPGASASGREGEASPDAPPRSYKRTRRARVTRERVWLAAVRIAIIAIFLGVWQWVYDVRAINRLFISSPGQIASQLGTWISNGTIVENTAVTLEEAAIGLLMSAVAGVAIGLFLARHERADSIARPFIDVGNTIPRIALAPLFVLWFGLGLTAKVALVFSVVVFNFIINTYTGVKDVDPELVHMARSLGGSQRAITVHIVMPSIAPWIFAAGRLGVGLGIGATVFGEILSAQHGLGYLIEFASGDLDTAGVFAALAVLAVIGWLATAAVAALERRLFKWQTSDDRTRSHR